MVHAHTFTSKIVTQRFVYRILWLALCYGAIVANNFIESKSITLEMAHDIAVRAVQAAKENKFKPVGVTVLDSSGNIVVQLRADSCPPGFLDMAKAKANACIKVGMSSRAYGKKYLSQDSTPDVFVRLLNQMAILDGQVACFQGGIILRDKRDNSVLGAVGVSGAAGDEDEYCAIMGAKQSAIGKHIVTDPPDHSCKTCRF